MEERPRIIIVAGPNGAGKTTFAREFLVREGHCRTFLNADLIAAGLSPFDPGRAALRAGRLMLEQIEEHVGRREDIAFETTLSGTAYVRRIRLWRPRGYRITLMFLRLPDVRRAHARVAQRVHQGGHDIPADVIDRRFGRGLELFETVYSKIVDDWFLYDNSGDRPVLIESSGPPTAAEPGVPRRGREPRTQMERDILEALMRAARRARQIALQTGTAVIVDRDGEMVRIEGEELRAQVEAGFPK